MSAAPDALTPTDTASSIDVAQSVTGRRWVFREGDDRAGLMLAQRLDLPEVVGRMLAARGVGIEDAPQFLNPTLRDALPDPNCLADMDRAVARLISAIQDGEPIAVFGDYDVDGATSSALLARFFAAAGAPVRIYIPDRIREGYGPNAPALLRLRAEGVKVVITVDCGITAFEPLAEAAEADLDVIVVDHHVAEPQLPAAAAVINPNRLDDTSDLGMLAAVGVSFLLAVALNRGLRDAGWYNGADRSEPDLLGLLDLVALGTVCDVVKLSGLNRAFVAQGLRVMARRNNTGLAALSDTARINEKPSEYHAGYVLGPRVNAGGRVGEASLGARLLTTGDAGEASELARQLDSFNAERQAIEAEVLEEALAMVEAADSDAPMVIVTGEGWHAGVIGIVASRLKEKYARPALVIGLDGDTGKGSGRSVEGIDLGSAVIAARQAGLLINGGGHKMAAGLTVERTHLADLTTFLNERIGAAAAAGRAVPTLNVDASVRLSGATLELIASIQQIAPFGAGNPEPRFVLPAVRVATADVVGKGHVRCILSDDGKNRLKAIAFRAAGEPLGDALLQTGGMPLHIAGKIRLDTWQGREGVQLIIDDAAQT
ncbi:MAG: single-stranded-DNA-specific exonuclease RecJ [Alphaproteobacteria bacterium]|nr:single-stranded-DNA-specific exonuclease RecJ [Alphaproteobacteria bacterium]